MRGFRVASCASHEPSGIDFRPNQFKRDIAPTIRSRRMSDCSALENRGQAENLLIKNAKIQSISRHKKLEARATRSYTKSFEICIL
jgi:hypothetical protein